LCAACAGEWRDDLNEDGSICRRCADKHIAINKSRNRVPSSNEWSADDIEYLRENYPKPDVTAQQIAEHLGRTHGAVTQKASVLGIKSMHPKTVGSAARDWSAEDIELLRELYPDPTVSTGWIADTFNRTEAAVMSKARKLGLTSPRSNVNKAKAKSPAPTTPAAKQVKTAAKGNKKGAEVLPDAAPETYTNLRNQHEQAIALAAKHGAKAMEGTPIVMDAKTVVIKRKK
jgi:hypothetical protein